MSTVITTQVKEERRTRRVAKKELKEAFKSEMLQIGRTGGPGEKLGVYKY